MNQRGITPAEVQEVLTRPVEVVTQSNGNHLFVGGNGVGVVVDGGTGEIVTVLA
jgi:hypothetical protein